MTSEAGLIQLTEATRMLAECTTIAEAMTIFNMAEAARVYAAMQDLGLEAENHAVEIKLRAGRRLGEMLLEAHIRPGQPRKNVDGVVNIPSPTLRELGISERLSSLSQQQASIPRPEFERYIAETKPKQRLTQKGVLDIARRLRRPVFPEPPPLPTGIYDLLYADPPWQYEHSKTAARDIENHYPTLRTQEICECLEGLQIAENAVLYLWATNPKLTEALEVMNAWGFTYRTNMVWIKPSIGMGYYARQRHELLLIGRRGNFPAPEASIRPDSVIEAPRLAHSAKPSLVYEMIERLYPAAERVEIFARGQRPGWSRWGNQAND